MENPQQVAYQAAINLLTRQRNAALDELVVLYGEYNSLKAAYDEELKKNVPQEVET